MFGIFAIQISNVRPTTLISNKMTSYSVDSIDTLGGMFCKKSYRHLATFIRVLAFLSHNKPRAGFQASKGIFVPAILISASLELGEIADFDPWTTLSKQQSTIDR